LQITLRQAVAAFGRIRSRQNRAWVVHGLFLWQPPAMPETTPDDDLETSIAFALSRFGYDPPRKSSPAERALYFRAVARAVRKHLRHSWTMTKQPPQQIAPSAWRPGDKSPSER
jgi:hypothetical protein